MGGANSGRGGGGGHHVGGANSGRGEEVDTMWVELIQAGGRRWTPCGWS